MTAVRKTRAAHISIEGEGFTRIARDFMLCDSPAQAWRFVTKNLHGSEVHAFATELLDGKKKLVGDSTKGMKPARDSAKEYVKTLKYIYAGRVRVDRCWYRPRAAVVGFGSDDAHYAAKELREDDDLDLNHEAQTPIGEGASRLREFYRARVAYYARTGERVVEVGREKDGRRRLAGRFLIFEPVSEPPFWWPEHLTPEAALDEFLEVGHRLTTVSWEDPLKEFEPERLDDDEEPASLPAQEISDSAREALEVVRATKWKAKLNDIKRKVLEQAGGDMMSLLYEDGRMVSVPRAPFYNWALRRTSLKHLAPPWECVSPVGMKLQMDDPNHTDWVLGAGLDLGDAYGGTPLDKAATNAMGELQEKLGHFKTTVIVGGKEVYGVVGKEIAILPNLHPDHLEKIIKAKAVITEAGGQLAHLAQVAMERAIPILLVPDACTRFCNGMKLRIYSDEGLVSIDMERK